MSKNKNIDFKYLICSDGSVILDENFNILDSVVFDKIVINKIIEQLQNDTNLRFLDIDANVFGISAIYAIFNSMEYAEKVLNGFLNKYEVSGYVSTHGIKIINKNISKVSGIEYIRNIINIEEDNIYTIGDRINDLEMIDKYNGYLIGKDVHNFKEFIEMIDNITCLFILFPLSLEYILCSYGSFTGVELFDSIFFGLSCSFDIK